MVNSPVILSGLHEIARDYDALVCDVWGVLHNGAHTHAPAVDALKRFRGEFGPVVLLSNAPRPVDALEEQFKKIGVPKDCYDAIVRRDIKALGASFNLNMKCWEALLPHVVRHPAAGPNARRLAGRRTPGWRDGVYWSWL